MVFALSKASKRVLKSMKQTAPLSNFGKETGGSVKGTLSCYLDSLSYDRNEGFVILLSLRDVGERILSYSFVV